MSLIIYITVTEAYAKFKKWAHGKIGHDKKKRRRLRKEAKKLTAKLLKQKEDDDLLRYGVWIDPADAVPQAHTGGRIISFVNHGEKNNHLHPNTRYNPMVKSSSGNMVKSNVRSRGRPNVRQNVRSKNVASKEDGIRTLQELTESLKLHINDGKMHRDSQMKMGPWISGRTVASNKSKAEGVASEEAKTSPTPSMKDIDQVANDDESNSEDEKEEELREKDRNMKWYSFTFEMYTINYFIGTIRTKNVVIQQIPIHFW
jgi:hypothetical protein